MVDPLEQRRSTDQQNAHQGGVTGDRSHQGGNTSPQDVKPTFQVMGPGPLSYTGPKLNNKNWSRFSFAFQAFLRGLHLSDYLEDSIATGNEADVCYSLIIGAVESDQLDTLFETSTPAQAWAALQNAHRRVSSQNVVLLSHEFRQARMKEDQDVQDFTSHMLELVRQIKAAGGAEISDMDFFTTVLLAIQDLPRFAVVVECLLNGSVLKKSDLISRLREAEKRAKQRSTTDHQSALRADAGRDNRRSGKRKEKKSRQASNQGQKKVFSKSEDDVCKKCGQRGHWARGCRSKNTVKNPKEEAKAEEEANAAIVEYLFTAMEDEGGRDSWLMDSGASSHMINRRDLLESSRTLNPPVKITLGDGSHLFATQIGVVRLTEKIKLKDVLYVEKIHENLFSTSAACKTKGVEARQFGNYYQIHHNGKIVMSVRRTNGMFRFFAKDLQQTESAVAMVSIVDLHRRCGHSNYTTVKNMINDGILTRPNEKTKIPETCVVCSKGKMTRSRVPKHGSNVKRQIGELIHGDICGPMRTRSLQGSSYLATYIDDASNYVHVACIQEKSKQLTDFMAFHRTFEKQHRVEIRTFRTDGGGEYSSRAAVQYLKEHGIRWERSTPRTPQENGKAERMNRTLVEMARCLLIDAQLPKPYWEYAIMMAAYIRNRTPSSANENGTSPYELLFGRKPNLRNLMLFGGKVEVHVPDISRGKLDPKSRTCIFLGFADGMKACIFQDIKTKQRFVSRDWRDGHERSVLNSSSDETPLGGLSRRPEWRVIIGRPMGDNSAATDQVQSHDDAEIEVVQGQSGENVPLDGSPSDSDDETSMYETGVEDNVDDRELEQRATLPPSPNTSEDHYVPYEETLRSTSRQRKPRNFLLHTQLLGSATINESEPPNAQEALKSSEWIQAMKEEYDALETNKTWELVKLPKGRRAISGRWCYKIKRDSTGSATRYKARYVARGFTQQPGIDFDETFSPVVSLTSLRVMLAYAANAGLHLRQLDVNTAFLYGHLEEELYLQQPEGFEKLATDGSRLVCRLSKAIYGLKQAGRIWWQQIDAYLKTCGFESSSSDPCIYTRRAKGDIMIIAIYVDDLILASSTTSALDKMESTLRMRYSMKASCDLSYILGIKVQHDKATGNITLSQEAYARSILERYGMASCRPVCSPSAIGEELVPHNGRKEEFDYQQAVGSLMYLMQGTRPDLAHSVGKVARFSKNPGPAHVKAVKRVMRYVSGTLGAGICYRRGSWNLIGYADADFAGDVRDRKSTSGTLFMLSGGPVRWASKKQTCVSLSTTEAEYVSLCMATKEAIWLRRLLSEMGCADQGPTLILEDNQGAIAMTENERITPRTKHISVKYHFVRHAVKKGTIVIEYCPTEEMLADIMTKALSPSKFGSLASQILSDSSKRADGSVERDDHLDESLSSDPDDGGQ